MDNKKALESSNLSEQGQVKNRKIHLERVIRDSERQWFEARKWSERELSEI